MLKWKRKLGARVLTNSLTGEALFRVRKNKNDKFVVNAWHPKAKMWIGAASFDTESGAKTKCLELVAKR